MNLDLARILATLPRDQHQDWIEWFNERAGIMEYDGHMSRADAESVALADLRKFVREKKNVD